MIIFLFGSDTFRANKKIKQFKDKFVKKFDPNNDAVSVLDGEKTDIDTLNSFFYSQSLFTSRRMVILNNFFCNKNETVFKLALELLKKTETEKDDDNIIIWQEEKIGKHPTKAKKELWSFLKKTKFAEELKELSEPQINSWIKEEFKKRGVGVSMSTASLLNSMLDSDMWAIDNEIDKLIHFKKGQVKTSEENIEISDSDVNALTTGNFNEKIFALTDAIGARNKKLTLRLFTEQLNVGTSSEQILPMILWQFKNLLCVRQALDVGTNPGQIASQLKIHPFVAQKNINQVRSYSLEFLKRVVSHLVLIQRRSRQGENTVNALSLLLLKIL